MTARTTLEVRGARENNLRGVDVEIPRDKIVVFTGVSGSGKSSLAFDTIFAEGQRRLMESMSSYARRFVSQLKRPKVDFVQGLSPVVSIEQKTITRSPRSTVGTLTDVSDYLRMLFATVGIAHCPQCEQAIESYSTAHLVEKVLRLPSGTTVEVRAPVARIYGEDWNYLLEHIRANGYRRARVDAREVDLGDDVALDEDVDYRVEAIIDTWVVGATRERDMTAALEQGFKVGDGLVCFEPQGLPKKQVSAFYADFGCRAHHIVAGPQHHRFFGFNDPTGACPTCTGIGTHLRVHPKLLIPDDSRSLAEGAVVNQALIYNKNNWGGRMLTSLAAHYGFSLDTPYRDLSAEAVDIVLYGTRGKRIEIVIPDGATQGQHHAGKNLAWEGVVNRIEGWYHHHRKHGGANASEEWFKTVMVEYDCPQCDGARLKRVRQLVTINDLSISQVGELHLRDLRGFLDSVRLRDHQREVGQTIINEISTRVDVLVDIGLDYLNLNRRSASLSGGESQRIRLSSQIGSGLMGMLYVLDEPSIGLHARDAVRMIDTLRRLRDIGNTVVVVEHDEAIIRAADWLVEMGPGAGIHGGEVVASGPSEEVLVGDASLTAQYVTGRARIELPKERRPPSKKVLGVRGARENNLRSLDIDIPLGRFVCVTGASGSGKSSLLNEIVMKRLHAHLKDSRTMYGEHDDILGIEQVDDFVAIDQTPIGRNARSNPATYIGFYDNIRKVFAATDEAKARGYKTSRFSFNVKGGRCEECQGAGTITTSLSFMPDIEVDCPRCKGARYNRETLEITYRDRTIAQVLDMPIEEGCTFFEEEKSIARKLLVLNELGLGYLTIGHPAPILSGGEAQRVKLANELSKVRRGKHILYLLDEPTTGLHYADIDRLLSSLQALVDRGHSVVVIEHNLEVVKCADWVIDLGPQGGHAGGELVVAGTPEEVAMCSASFTGQFLGPLLSV